MTAQRHEADQTRLERYSPNGYRVDKARDAAATLTARTGIPPIDSEIDDRDYPHFAWVLATRAVQVAITDALREGADHDE